MDVGKRTFRNLTKEQQEKLIHTFFDGEYGSDIADIVIRDGSFHASKEDVARWFDDARVDEQHDMLGDDSPDEYGDGSPA